jgi:hypothetical protein
MEGLFEELSGKLAWFQATRALQKGQAHGEADENHDRN